MFGLRWVCDIMMMDMKRGVMSNCERVWKKMLKKRRSDGSTNMKRGRRRFSSRSRDFCDETRLLFLSFFMK